MVLESFGRAPLKAKVLNLSVLALSFAAFIGCCVGFAADMFRASVQLRSGILAHWSFHQAYMQTDANRIDYSDPSMCIWEFCSSCTSGGRGFLAMQVLAFLSLLVLLCITTFRVFGGVAISALAHPSRSLVVESWVSLVATLFFFLSTVIFGATCERAVKNTEAFTTSISGFAYTILCLIFLLVQLVVMALIRRDERCHLGFVDSNGFDALNDEEARRPQPNAALAHDAPYDQTAAASSYGSTRRESA